MSPAEKPENGKATGLFPDSATPQRGGASGLVTANIDGGARGNPGPAAYGVVLRKADGSTLVAAGKYVGRATNNVAEYYGLIAALDAAAHHGVRRLRVESDSELLVRQMQGEYRVNSPDLRPLHERAERLARGLEHFEIVHVPRERNREADRLVNEALDGKRGENRNSKGENRGENKPASGGRVLRARVQGGALVPEEPLGLREGEVLVIRIEPGE